jgi:hypothetical protein
VHPRRAGYFVMTIAQINLLYMSAAVLWVIPNPMTWGFFCCVVGLLIGKHATPCSRFRDG